MFVCNPAVPRVCTAQLQKMRLESIELFKKAPGREDMIQAEQVSRGLHLEGGAWRGLRSRKGRGGGRCWLA